MAKVLVTGGAGFVGRALCPSLAAAGHEVVATTRRRNVELDVPRVRFETIGDQSSADWRGLVAGIDAVVHLAARAHMLDDTAADPLAQFRATNTAATEQLALAAAAAGVGRFVLVSTIKVLGERTGSRAFTHTDPASPSDPYGVSKLEAELALKRVAGDSGMGFVVLRPALVYGPGVRGNLERVLKLVDRGIPLPLARVRNLRSLVALDNLCEVIRLSIECDAAASETLLVADDVAVSTPELFRIVARHMRRPVRLFPFPVPLLKLAGGLLGHSAEVRRLCENLCVEIDHTKKTLGWTPRTSPTDGFAGVVAAYLEEGRRCRA